MSRTLPALLLSISLAAACAPAATRGGAVASPRGVAATVDSVASTAPLQRTRWGVHVTRLDGTPVFALNEEQLFTVASNAKLATMGAALALLGPDHRWSTGVEVHGLIDGVAEAVVVRGSGDPTFSAHFHGDALAPLDSLADSLALAGLQRVSGPLVVDQSRFDSVLVHPAWENFDLDWYYAAPVAPFAVMEGAWPVVVQPGARGGAAAVEVLVPAGLVGVDARVVTVDGDRGWNDELRRVSGRDSLVLRGRIGADAGRDTSWIAQTEPGRFAGRALRRALEARGIAVEGGVVVSRVREDPVPAAPGPRIAWRSPPLADVARLSLEQSDNWVTEQVLKTLGAEHGEGGSWSAGTAVVEGWLRDSVGVDAGAMYLRDGSGLTAQDLLTPAALTALLRHAAQEPWAAIFRDALAAPGEVGSTLENRLVEHGQNLTAKTGTIRHVNALSGYVRTLDGEILAFSILTNASGRPSSEVRRGMDRIVEAIIRNGS